LVQVEVRKPLVHPVPQPEHRGRERPPGPGPKL